MECVQCGGPNPGGQKFCGQCGAKRPVSLPSVDQARGYTPAHLAEKILKSRSALEGERKPVTVHFCDIANSTGLAERIGAEDMHRVLNAFFESALAKVHEFEGTVNQFLGDGFMALFGAPWPTRTMPAEPSWQRSVSGRLLTALTLRNMALG